MLARWYRKPGPQVALGFALLMLAQLAAPVWLPSLEQPCAAACESTGMKGLLTPGLTGTQTAGNGGRGGPAVCKCV